MEKKDYVKPVMEVVEADTEQQILAGSYLDIQINNSLDDDVPVYGGFSDINPWDAN